MSTQTKEYEPILGHRVTWIGHKKSMLVGEHSHGLLKGNTVLLKIGIALPLIPFELQTCHKYNIPTM